MNGLVEGEVIDPHYLLSLALGTADRLVAAALEAILMRRNREVHPVRPVARGDGTR